MADIDILQTGADAEEASAIDPRALPWVQAKLKTAFEERCAGLFAVSVGESTERAAGKIVMQRAGKGLHVRVDPAPQIGKARR